MVDVDPEERPLFSAVSSSARQLYLLLRCISFSEKAQVQISEEGLRFSVEESSVMEGLAFLDKSLFTSYQYNSLPQPPHSPSSQNSVTSDTCTPEPPTFQISLPSLLETLQIFGLTDPNSSRPLWSRDAPSTAFSTQLLGMNNLCRLSYAGPGSLLSVILTESTTTTTCALTTYEPAFTTDIPFTRHELALKIIMRASWLHDAISELASTSSSRLTLLARTQCGRPFFALSASGPLGSARVEFNTAASTTASANSGPGSAADASSLLETFQLADPGARVCNTYKFALVQKAARAMAVATKVSVRGDAQGVLSLQFMIELEPGKVSFVDFRFVPYVAEEGDEEDVEDEGGGDDEGEEDDDEV